MTGLPVIVYSMNHVVYTHDRFATEKGRQRGVCVLDNNMYV